MKTYNITWNWACEVYVGKVSEAQLLEYCKDNKLELPTGINEFANIVKYCAYALNQYEKEESEPSDPHLIDFSLDEE